MRPPHLSVVSIFSGPQLWTKFRGFPTVLGHTQMSIKHGLSNLGYEGRGMACSQTPYGRIAGIHISFPPLSLQQYLLL